jgi:hypothetical protein
LTAKQVEQIIAGKMKIPHSPSRNKRSVAHASTLFEGRSPNPAKFRAGPTPV